MVSPLESSYNDQIESLAHTLNSLNGAGTIHCFPFNTMAEFAQQIQVLIEQAQPWESEYAEAIE
jgi:CRISPR-associated protein Cst2